MKLGVVSDTHLTSIDDCRQLAEVLLEGPFADVEAVLHAGDVVIPGLESCFLPVPWYGVRGNMDVMLVDLPTSRVLQFGDTRIGMIHGWGGHDDLEQRVLASFADQQLDALVYGHSHQPVCHRVGSVLVMNPGSATDRRKAPYHTVGILTLDKIVSGEIINLD